MYSRGCCVEERDDVEHFLLPPLTVPTRRGTLPAGVRIACRLSRVDERSVGSDAGVRGRHAEGSRSVDGDLSRREQGGTIRETAAKGGGGVRGDDLFRQREAPLRRGGRAWSALRAHAWGHDGNALERGVSRVCETHSAGTLVHYVTAGGVHALVSRFSSTL